MSSTTASRRTRRSRPASAPSAACTSPSGTIWLAITVYDVDAPCIGRVVQGAVFADNRVWYECAGSQNNTVATRIARGCIFNQQRIGVGQKYVESRVLFQCQVCREKGRQRVGRRAWNAT